MQPEWEPHVQRILDRFHPRVTREQAVAALEQQHGHCGEACSALIDQLECNSQTDESTDLKNAKVEDTLKRQRALKAERHEAKVKALGIYKNDEGCTRYADYAYAPPSSWNLDELPGELQLWAKKYHQNYACWPQHPKDYYDPLISTGPSASELVTVTEVQFEIYQADFRACDSDGSGYLEDREITALLTRQLGSQPTAKQVRTLMRNADRDADGKISLHEVSFYLSLQYAPEHRFALVAVSVPNHREGVPYCYAISITRRCASS